MTDRLRPGGRRLYSVRMRSTEPSMRYSSQVGPISFLKANAAEILADLADGRRDMPGLLARRLLGG